MCDNEGRIGYLLSIEAKFFREEIQHLSPCHFNLWEFKLLWLLWCSWAVRAAPLKGCVWQWSAFRLEPHFAEIFMSSFCKLWIVIRTFFGYQSCSIKAVI